MNEYKIFLSRDANHNKEDLEVALNELKLKHKDSVITKKDKISVVTEYSTDIDVFVGGMEAWTQTKENHKPVLLCDIDCSKIKEIKDCTIPYTWGLFSSENKENEKKFLEYYNLSFIYGNKANVIKDYIAPLVFCMLEEFSFHDKYNKEGFGYKKQAEFIHEFTQFYLDKMKELAGMADFVRDDIKDDFYHIIYKYRPEDENKPFYSIDGRDYDFVIEYHRGKPSEGIYYGIKGEVKEGEVKEGDLEGQCEKFREEWPNIFMKKKETLLKEYKRKESDKFWGYNFQLELTEILNNTFPWKDYLKCYKPTDNMWEKRYWLFWVTLNDDEDINRVAARAVRLMAKTFKRCIMKRELYESPKEINTNECDNDQDTYFTIESFDNFRGKMGKNKDGRNNGDMLIKKLEEEKCIFKDERYEMCYRCKIPNNKIKKILKEKDKEIFPYKGNERHIPWEYIERVLLPKTLHPSKGSFQNAKS